MQLNGEGFKIHFDDRDNTVYFEGTLRLENLSEYAKIEQFLLDVHELNLPALSLDFKKVEFLNSSGIATLCKFIMEAKKLNKMQVNIIGNEEILWQKKSFMNMKLLWDRVNVHFVRVE